MCKLDNDTDQDDLLENSLAREEWIRIAREKHQSEGTLEIDDNAVISQAEETGAYVQAWVWVDNPNYNPEDEEDEEENES